MYKEIETIALEGLASVVALRKGSLLCTVGVSSLSALKEIWRRYRNGQLKKSFEDVFITDKIKKLVKDETLSLKAVEISQTSYQVALSDLTQFEGKTLSAWVEKLCKLRLCSLIYNRAN